MSWLDRLRESAYTPPSGSRIVFSYEDVTRAVEKKTVAFDFPDADGTLIQDLGHKSRRYPLRVIFHGADHDTQADAFELALLERGAGLLEHPRYGRVTVVPFGEITQRDDLKTAASQTIIEVVFFATIDAVYPAAGSDPAADALAAVEEFNDVAAAEFTDAVQVDTAVESATLREQWSDYTAQTVAALGNDFKNISDSVLNGLNVLIGDPLTLAAQTLVMINTPSRTAALVADKLAAYGNLLTSITTGASRRIGGGASGPVKILPSSDGRAGNELAARALFTRSAVAGSITATVMAVQTGGFDTQPKALAAAEAMLAQLDEATDWIDETHNTLDAVDTGGAHQSLYAAAALAASAIIQDSFGLKRERRVVLDRPRSIIDLTAQYYGSVDQNLDFFISSNDFTGSELLEVPRGRTVLVYV